jgi:hypothetical protein
MPRFPKILGATEAPFLLASLIALAAWAGTHVVDRALESPLIEYSYDWIEGPSFPLLPCKPDGAAPKYYLRINVRNLSRNARFNNLELAFRIPDKSGGAITGIHIETVPPAVPNRQSVGRCGAAYALFSDLNFQPKTEFHLLLGLSARRLPVAHLWKAGEAVYFREGDIETILVRYESLFVTLLLVMTLALAIIYLAF